MRPGTRQALLHRRTAALTAAAALAVVAAIAPPATAADDATCAQVRFIGVRGSGQSVGYGAQVDDVLYGFAMSMSAAGHRPTVDYHALDYTAAPVETLAAAGGIDEYIRSITTGVQLLDVYIDNAAARCPSQTLVLAGYSQGAMVVQEYLSSPEASAAILTRVAGAGLVASGDRERPPGWIAHEYGTATPSSGARTTMLLRNPPNISTQLRGRVLSLCDRGDLVCDTARGSARPLTAIDIHVNAYQWGKGADLGQRLAQLALGAAYPQDAAYTVRPGEPVDVTLHATMYVSGFEPLWRIDSGELPPGLQLDPVTGRIAGTPTTEGTFDLHVAVEGRTWKVWVPATVSFRVQEPVVDPPPPPPTGDVTVDFQGTVTEASRWVAEDEEGNPVPGPTDPVLPDDIQVGTPVTGSYTFRASTPDTHWDPTDATSGVYRYTAAPYGVSLAVGSLTYATTYPSDPWTEPFTIATTDAPWGDSFQWNVMFPSASNGVPVLDFDWWSAGPPTALTSDALPSGALNLSTFDSTRLRVTGCADEVYNADWGCATSAYGMEIQITSTSTRP
ncbi:cutinase family protein [Actinotalea solisilvae]|uniref:cutinase family protein n=1 Tax=Actinotalea solisilvae TaxID=2072922 RepID=UPI0018F1326B|nr:cutinase family protein [Actinotalea solisilvae]